MCFNKITEQQAQELASLLQMFISVDKSGLVCAFHREPVQGSKRWYGHKDHFAKFPDTDYELPVKIYSERLWTERLFKPCRLTSNHTTRAHEFVMRRNKKWIKYRLKE